MSERTLDEQWKSIRMVLLGSIVIAIPSTLAEVLAGSLFELHKV